MTANQRSDMLPDRRHLGSDIVICGRRKASRKYIVTYSRVEVQLAEMHCVNTVEWPAALAPELHINRPALEVTPQPPT